jgi:S-(hydroxymethyl)glutathione dehydrogenase/alcohol dehydrogenase
MKTRAAVFWGPERPFTVEEIDIAPPGPGDVVVRMAAAGICGTDLHCVKGEWSRPTPMVLGHEGVGIVEAVGSEVEDLASGDKVVLSWAASCGECADCGRSRPAACARLQTAIGTGTLIDGTTGMSLRGETLYRGSATGCLAEHVVVSSRAALRTADDVPVREGALLGCAALTGVGAALFAAPVTPGSSVLVVGAGGVGQFVVQGARIGGATTIVVVDPVESRREQALRVGATHAFHPDELESELADVAPDGVDFAFDAVGDPSTTEAALGCTRSGGTAVIVGLPPAGARLDLDPAQLTRREKHLVGTMYGSEDPAIALPVLLEHVREGRLELGELVGPVFELDRVNQAIEASLAAAAGRVIVTFDGNGTHD